MKHPLTRELLRQQAPLPIKKLLRPHHQQTRVSRRRQETSSKRCWNQKDGEKEGLKEGEHRRRKDRWMGRRCDGRRPRVFLE